MRCSRFVAFFLALVTGAIGAGMSLLVLTEVPREIKEISACVQSVKVVVRQSRSRRGLARASYDLWIDARDHRQGFVHHLGFLFPEKDLAQRIRPGDCVVMRVDRTKLGSLDARSDYGSLMIGWINSRLEPLDLAIPLDDGTSRVKILTLEKGPNTLISYLDSFGLRLGIPAGMALMFIFSTLALLRMVIIGRAVGDLEPVSFVSPEGYSLSLAKDSLTYRERGRTLRLWTLQELKPPCIRVFTGGVPGWAPPYHDDPLTPGHFDRILDRIEVWLCDEDLNHTFDPNAGFDPTAN